MQTMRKMAIFEETEGHCQLKISLVKKTKNTDNPATGYPLF